MQTLISVAVRATFLSAVVVALGLAVHSRQALPAEADDGFNAPQVVNSAAKSDAVPLPRAKPGRPAEPETCKAPLAGFLAMLTKARVYTGAKALAYLAAGFDEHPPADTIALIEGGETVGLILAKNGCVVGRQVIPTKAHKAILDKAFGVIA